jgi:putative ABC transport system permease protein
MLFRLALRNVGKTLPKRLAFGSFFAATMALLFLGNTLFENSDRGLAATYVDSFTAQASLSAPSPEQFTLFGSDLPMIGDFLILPILPHADALAQKITAARPHAQTLAQVSALATLAYGSFRQNVPVFGVDFPHYFQFFPSLKVLSGHIPAATEPAAMLTKAQGDEVARSLGRPLVIGETFTLNFLVGNSFVSRKVALAGVYDHPAADQLADRIVLTDPDTARALNGYLYGATAKPLDAATQHLLDTDLDSLAAEFSSASASGFGASATPSPAPTPAPATEAASAQPAAPEGPAWNFLLVREAGRSDAEVLASVKAAVAGETLQVRDWRETAGGSALIASFLRILFNVGLFFIAVVSCLILINSLSLSILERTREIGTMRALGAERSFVGGLIAYETLILVFGTGLFGILVGVAATYALDAAHLPLTNVYLSSLFGGRQLRVQPSWSGVVFHAFLGLVLGGASVLLPVRRALSIQPVKAIARDQ